MKLILPGVFLLLLGVGNIWVGSYKADQYREVIEELSLLQPTPGLEGASTLRRIQLAEEVSSRHYERLAKARARLDFYQLVTYGGKVFVGLSAVFLLGGMMLSYLQQLSARTPYQTQATPYANELEDHESRLAAPLH